MSGGSFSLKNSLNAGWLTTWRNKKLILFGIFVMTAGTSAEIELLLRTSNITEPGLPVQLIKTIADTGLLSIQGLQGVFTAFSTNPIQATFAISVLLLLLVIGCLYVWAATAAHGGLIYSSALIQQGKKNFLKRSFQVGLKKFWPLLLIITILKIITTAILAILSLLIFSPIEIFLPVFLVFFVITLFVSFIAKFAACSVVLDNVNFSAGLKKALRIFTKNKAISIKLAVALFFINILVILSLTIMAFLIITPFLLITGTALFLEIISALTFNLYFAALLILSLVFATASYLSIFHWASWINLYSSLEK